MVDCLRQKITTNLLLSLLKANEEGATLLNKYDDVRQHFVNKLAAKKKAMIELTVPIKIVIEKEAN